MSRIAKNPVMLPKGVEVAVAANEITVKGPLGSLRQRIHSAVRIEHVATRPDVLLAETDRRDRLRIGRTVGVRPKPSVQPLRRL